MADTMSDPLTWSVSVGRYFGIRVRVHIFFVAYTLYQLAYSWLKGGLLGLEFTAGVSVVLFFSILFHEFGHCFSARALGGEAEDVLMWPLGGLAFVSVPRTPRAEFISTIWGPLVNVFIGLAAGGVLLLRGFIPPLNPFTGMTTWQLARGDMSSPVFWIGVIFWLNLVLLLFNLVPAFPMDAGRMLRSTLWGWIGHTRATLIAVQVGKVAAILMAIVGLIANGLTSDAGMLLLLGIALFVYVSCENERRMLEAGELTEDNPFGYDFSQGYTSLAKSSPKTKARRPGVFERWRRRRDRIKQQKELAAQQAEERRVDEILDKVHREGIASLTDQERRFLNRASEKKARSRNRMDD